MEDEIRIILYTSGTMCQGKAKVKLSSLPQEFKQASKNKIIQNLPLHIEGKKVLFKSIQILIFT